MDVATQCTISVAETGSNPFTISQTAVTAIGLPMTEAVLENTFVNLEYVTIVQDDQLDLTLVADNLNFTTYT